MNEDIFKRDEGVDVLDCLLCNIMEEAEAIKHYSKTVHKILNNTYASPTRAQVLRRIEHIIADEMEHMMLLAQNYTDMTNINVEVNTDVSNKSVQQLQQL